MLSENCSFSEPITSADKYPSIFSRQMEAFVHIVPRFKFSFCGYILAISLVVVLFNSEGKCILFLLVLRETSGDGVGCLLECSGAAPLVNNCFSLLR